jgi:hypothetical protein
MTLDTYEVSLCVARSRLVYRHRPHGWIVRHEVARDPRPLTPALDPPATGSIQGCGTSNRPPCYELSAGASSNLATAARPLVAISSGGAAQ